MFGHRRQECLEEIKWNQCHGLLNPNDTITVLDFWRYEGDQIAIESQNWQCRRIAAGQRQRTNGPGEVESKIKDYLNREHPYQPPLRAGGQTPCGGLRLVLCEKRGMEPSMAMSKDAFIAIERAFNLHPATLPLMTMIGGPPMFAPRPSIGNNTDSTLHMIIKTPQKRDIMNFTLSLSYNMSDRCTYAFLCGDCLIEDRPATIRLFGNQYARLMAAITADPNMWDNPMLLPFVLLENYIYRLERRAHTLDYRVQRLELHVGATWGVKSWAGVTYEGWPENVDTRRVTPKLHSTVAQIVMIGSCCRWLRSCTTGLADAVRWLESDGGIDGHKDSFRTLHQTAEVLCSMSESIDARFSAFKARTTQQIDLVYNIISQQTSQMARRDTMLSFRIAESGKQDSISVTTFTFITALFLPGTFVATLFSMSMFDWQPDGGGSSSESSANMSRSNVSRKFWVFWVIVIPLTLTTMAFWYFWSRYAKDRWIQELRGPIEPDHYQTSSPSHSPSSIPLQPINTALEQRTSSDYRGLASQQEIRSWMNLMDKTFDDDHFSPHHQSLD